MDNKKIIGARIKEIRLKKGMTMVEFGELLDTSKSNVSMWESGRSLPNPTRMLKIAKMDGITVSDLIKKNDNPEKNQTLKAVNDVTAQLKTPRQYNVLKYAIKQLDAQNNDIYNVNNDIREDETEYSTIKLYGAVSAGKGVTLYDEYTDVIPYPKPIPEHDIALQVQGDSMLPLFRNKEIVFVNKTHEINHGQIGVFILNGEGYLKKFYKINNDVRLLSVNEAYQDITIDEQDDLRLIGTVVF